MRDERVYFMVEGGWVTLQRFLNRQNVCPIKTETLVHHKLAGVVGDSERTFLFSFSLG